MERISYEGFVIQASPYQLADSGEWEINIYIEKDRGRETLVRKFFASNSYPTREEAIQHCLNFGRQIIDGKNPNCSVDDL